ncbi:MAG: hypothetical protein C5B50_13445 [Verrucomicrobia bacterium]|nr:MAG: hypothetical protein C5B50_13445 [Verrucomicrobiota bacterium]
MNAPYNRREFLTEVGRGMVIAAVGYEVATDLGFASALAEEVSDRLSFGALEPLVCLMQETPVNGLLPILVDKLHSGTDLRQLTAAAALANARTFGGEDYVGFHTMMALAPALHMSRELPTELQPLPVFKVLYRNTNRIQEHGGRKDEVLHAVSAEARKSGPPGSAGILPASDGESLRAAVRREDVNEAEQTFARIAQSSPDDAFNSLLFAVDDHTEVHRVVLPYRAWDLLGLIGKEQAHTLLRQSVRYCVKAESWQNPPGGNTPRNLLPKMLEEHKLLGKTPGDRKPDDAWVEQTSQAIFKSTPEQAAEIAAASLAEGISPASLGEAITLAANQLILRDMGRTAQSEVPGKPIGSVHGDSIGVHACDSANAWRNMALVTNSRNCFACLILGAYQVAFDRTARGGDFLNWQPLPLARHLQEIKSENAQDLLRDAEEAIRGNLQAKASAVAQRYGELGHDSRPLFDLLLRYAVSEDGSLHAEKFYRTVSEEFAATRAAYRWRHVVALARVTASEFGRPAAGIAEARSLLQV